MSSSIQYASIDATNIPYKDHFDVVTFKSVLGGISRSNDDLVKQRVIDEIYKALKPEGVLLFAENIEGSFLHKILRKRFVNWGKDWNYLKLSEMEEVFSKFTSVSYVTVGFWGVFGRTERQRNMLGRFDRVFERLVPRAKRYILIGIARK